MPLRTALTATGAPQTDVYRQPRPDIVNGRALRTDRHPPLTPANPPDEHRRIHPTAPAIRLDATGAFRILSADSKTEAAQ